jgi:hypothetical protein
MGLTWAVNWTGRLRAAARAEGVRTVTPVGRVSDSDGLGDWQETRMRRAARVLSGLAFILVRVITDAEGGQFILWS